MNIADDKITVSINGRNLYLTVNKANALCIRQGDARNDPYFFETGLALPKENRLLALDNLESAIQQIREFLIQQERSKTYRLVDTDNFGGDYPNEKWATRYTFRTKEEAEAVQTALNNVVCPDMTSARFVKVVEMPYELQPGFEP